MAAYLYPPYVLLWEKMPGKTMQKLMADTMGPHLQVLPNDAQLPKLQQWQFLGEWRHITTTRSKRKMQHFEWVQSHDDDDDDDETE